MADTTVPETTLAHVIGQNVARYRSQAGLTQAQLAEAVDVSSVFISRVERGQKMMKVTTLQAIARVLHVSCDALLSPEGPVSYRENILYMLSQQSPQNLCRLERFIRVFTEESSGEELPPSLS